MSLISKIGYSSGRLTAAIQPQDALFALRLLVTIVPFLVILIGDAIISRYPFHGDSLITLQKNIER